MFQANTDISSALGEFQIDGALFRYDQFVPRLYNYCKSIGFEMDKVMPSRAFCSDENQGYPTILIAKHFRTFPFNHGRVGGVMATVRHKPHAAHGRDVVIVQASHVGYQENDQSFGSYRRLCTDDHHMSRCCGKLASVIKWYLDEYEFAKNNIFIEKIDGENFFIIDNQLLDTDIEQGLLVNLEVLVASKRGHYVPSRSLSTSKYFKASYEVDHLFNDVDEKVVIGDKLLPEHFYFKRDIGRIIEGVNMVEHNLLQVMPWVVASTSPLLTAAKVNVQVEFDRAFRTIAKEQAYAGKRLVYIAGLNIDISPKEGQLFPVTMFVPWAMYVQCEDGDHGVFEQSEIIEMLNQQSCENVDQLNLDEAISVMQTRDSVSVIES